MHSLMLIEPTAPLLTVVKHMSGYTSSCQDFTSCLEQDTPPELIIISHSTQTIREVEYLLSELEALFPLAKIVVLSTNYSSHTARAFYSCGADLCIAQHVGICVLNFLVNKLVLLSKQKKSDVLSYPNLSLNTESGVISIGKTAIQLRKRESQIFACLLRNKNHTVSRSRIIDTVWRAQDLPAHSTLDVYIRRLRMKLGSYKSCIETVRGFGYRATLAPLAG